MSVPEIELVRVDALALPELERASLARDLVASLDGPADHDAGAAWDVELCRRINEVEGGSAELLDVEDVLKKARARLAEN